VVGVLVGIHGQIADNRIDFSIVHHGSFYMFNGGGFQSTRARGLKLGVTGRKEREMKTIQTGYGIVRMWREGEKIIVSGNVSTRRFANIAAAKKFCAKNVELGAGDEVDAYILGLRD
jgi:hypothetical protein